MRSRFNIKKWFEECAVQQQQVHIPIEREILVCKNARKRRGRHGKAPKPLRIFNTFAGKYEEEPNKAFNDSYSFIAKLKKKGYAVLGRGAHATVLAKADSKRVIKVLRAPQDGWIDYIRWADARGFTGTFAPKVYSYKYIKGSEHNFGIASMERLGRTLSAVNDQHPMSPVSGLLKYATYLHNDTAKKLLDFAVPGMASFTTALGAQYPVHSFDFHRENFMLRDDDSIVIVDPICGCGTKDVTLRFKARGAMPLAA